jgi:hypothetical protein
MAPALLTWHATGSGDKPPKKSGAMALPSLLGAFAVLDADSFRFLLSLFASADVARLATCRRVVRRSSCVTQSCAAAWRQLASHIARAGVCCVLRACAVR